MRIHLPLVLVWSTLLIPLIRGSSPLCTDSRAPVVLNVKLKFCQTDGGSCCDAAADAALQEQFDAMGGVYENQHIPYPPWAAQVTKPTEGIIFPIMGYKVSSSTTENMDSASIVGGYVYRGSADPCLYGRYLFADMYTSAMWTGSDHTDGSGKYTSTSIPLSCSEKTPIPCDESTNSPLGPIFSFGEDNKLDVFILASQGVYRIVQPTLCGYAHPNSATTKGVTPSGGSNGMAIWTKVLVIVLSVLTTVGGLVVWRCFCNNTAFCCNENVQVTNNNTMHGDSPSATAAKSGDIESAMIKPGECHDR